MALVPEAILEKLEPMRWALWPFGRQSDVGLYGRSAVSLTLGFVVVWPPCHPVTVRLST